MVAPMKKMEKCEGERFLAEHGSIMSEEAGDHLPRQTSSLEQTLLGKVQDICTKKYKVAKRSTIYKPKEYSYSQFLQLQFEHSSPSIFEWRIMEIVAHNQLTLGALSQNWSICTKRLFHVFSCVGVLLYNNLYFVA